MRGAVTKKKIIGSGSSTLTPSTSKRIRGALSAATPATRSKSSSKISSSLVSENDEDNLPLGTPRSGESFSIGERVFLHGLKKWGTVRYFGSTWFSDGKWVGIELLDESGRNDGTVQGHRYFTCKPKYGVFVRPNNCTKSGDATSASRKPARANIASPDRPSSPRAPSSPSQAAGQTAAPVHAVATSSQLSRSGSLYVGNACYHFYFTFTSIEDQVAALSREVAKISALQNEHVLLTSRIQGLEKSLVRHISYAHMYLCCNC